MVYYNENDPKKAAWIRELIKAEVVADGHVDERSIADVRGSDLTGYKQCHFFAGIAVWSYALRLAGVPDDRECWTGSCPCQPFSVAGKRKGKEDQRHLWPEFARLIGECRPQLVIGEQIGGASGRAWLDDVFDDLEALAYSKGAVDSPACGFGAPHIRNRLYWVAYPDSACGGRRTGSIPRKETPIRGTRQLHGSISDGSTDGSQTSSVAIASGERRERRWSGEACAGGGSLEPQRHGDAGELGHAGSEGLPPRECEAVHRTRGIDQRGTALQSSGTPCMFCAFSFDHGALGKYGCPNCEGSGTPGGMEHAASNGRQQRRAESSGGSIEPRCEPGPVNGFWHDAAWIGCKDGKYRPVECSPCDVDDGTATDLGFVRDPAGGFLTFPLQKKGKARVTRLRGSGDAIVAPQAAAFIRAVIDITSS